MFSNYIFVLLTLVCTHHTYCIQVNIVIAQIVTAQIGYSTIRSWTLTIHNPFLGFLPENRVIKASCYAYMIYFSVDSLTLTTQTRVLVTAFTQWFAS